MFRARPPRSRYWRTARRTYLARAAAVGALVVVPVACGTSDAEVLSAPQTQSTESPVADTTAAAPATPDTTAPDTAAAAESTAQASSGQPSGDVVPAGAELAVNFSYTPSSNGGRVRNPYIAVWVEDLDGNLIQTVALWYEQSGKGQRWLDDLRTWTSAFGATGGEVTTSGATRSPGAYSVVWDTTGLDGSAVAQGTYVVYVESAREHGPHQITSTEITLGAEPASASLPDDGELTALSAAFSV